MNKMFKKTLSLVGGLTLLVMINGPVSAANTVQFTQGNIINVLPGGSLTVDLVGRDFTEGPDGAAFSLAWDASVLDYASTRIANPPWDTSFVNDVNAASGIIDFVFLIKSVGNAGSNFDIASFTFNVLGNPGVTTTLALSNPAADTGFTLPGGTLIDVNYVNSQVQVVPVPAAAWLFGTGLMGLLGSMRSRKMLYK
jgi:archaellum component FlaG (FlaF/FlaG flagellin family)